MHSCQYEVFATGKNLSEVGSQRQQVQKGNPDIHLSSNTLELLLGDPEAFPSHKGYKIPQSCSGSTLETRGRYNQLPKTPQLSSSDAEEQRRGE